MISVVIPCHATAKNAAVVGQQLWYTVASATSALEQSGIAAEIIVVANGEHPDQAKLMHVAESCTVHFCGKDIDSPQSARHFGFLAARGEVLFSLDAHVVVPSNFFRQVLDDMADTGADFMGAAYRSMMLKTYANRVDWGAYLWGGESIFVPPRGDEPFKTAVHPHGAFAVTRDAYFGVGGYWRALRGFGGEESQLCFKLWLMGKTCWATPRTYHWHWLTPLETRHPEAFASESYARNFLMVAAAYSDEKQVRDSYFALQMFHWGNVSKFPMLVQDVLANKEALSEWSEVSAAGKYKNLRQLRQMFNAEGVLN